MSTDSGSASESEDDSSEAESPPKVTPLKSTKSKPPASSTPAKPKSNLDLLLDLDDSMLIPLKCFAKLLSYLISSVSGSHPSHDPVPWRIPDANVNTINSENSAISWHAAS